MRGNNCDMNRKAISMLLGIKRDDGVSDEQCDSFRHAVIAKAAAMEPDADAGARERSVIASAKFHELIGQRSAISTVPLQLSVDRLEQYRVKTGLDIWELPPDATAAVLGICGSEQQNAWTELSACPMRCKGDAITPCEVQWVNGDNEALELYRRPGTRLKRNKMWFQTDDPLTEGFLVYKYPYHQGLVVPATFDVKNCPQLAPIVDAYNRRVCEPLGAKLANHGIATAYENGADCITPHSDNTSTIAASDAAGCSLIGVLKTGPNGRPFEIAAGKESAPFFSKVLPPGTLLLMTVEANLKTVHSVPEVSDCGPSGSIVLRTITNRVNVGALVRQLEEHGPGGKGAGTRPAANTANAVAARALVSVIPHRTCPTSIDQLFWATADSVLPAISEDVFRTCKKVVFTREEWDTKQQILHEASAPIVAYSKKHPNKPVPWHTYQYNHERLVNKGFVSSAEPTMVVVANGTGRFAVKYIYLPLDDTPSEMLELAEYVYTDQCTPTVQASGLSEFGKRGGSKGEHGSMVMFGSHNFIPRGKRCPAIPAVYRINDPVDTTLNAKVVTHVNKLSEYEHAMIPSLAAKRDELADTHDPDRLHRMSDDCSAFAVSLACQYVVTAHDDSGEACETVIFANRNGTLPEGHSWDFAVGGHVHPLPNERGKCVLLFVEGKDVHHGTLPTSATEQTYDHGNFGSALVTKRAMIESLIRQSKRGEATPIEQTASNLYEVFHPTGGCAAASASTAGPADDSTAPALEILD